MDLNLPSSTFEINVCVAGKQQYVSLTQFSIYFKLKCREQQTSFFGNWEKVIRKET